MCRVIPVLLFVSNALALLPVQKTYYDLADAENHFSNFIQKYQKEYKSDEEYNKRLEIFKEHLKNINHLNEIHDAVFGVNGFSDVSYEEFARTRYGLLPSIASNTSTAVTVKRKWILDAPDSLDYRDQNLVTPVKDQGSCGSCYVFSAIGSIEGQNAMKHHELVSLSEQQGLDCDHIDYGCGGGKNFVNVMNALAKTGGSEREEDYPYEARADKCRTDPSKIKVKVLGGTEISTPTEEELKGAVAHYGPLSAGLHMPVGPDYNGGVISPPECDGSKMNHAILIVGYGTEPGTNGKDYWIIKNSWGANWGENGYFRLERGKQYCGIGSRNTACAEVA